MIYWFGITNQKGMQCDVDIGADIEKEGERKKVIDAKIISSTRVYFASWRVEMCIIRTRVSK